MGIFGRSRTRTRNVSVQNLYEALQRKSNAYENYADAPAAVNPAATMLTPQVGNPTFAAQFDVNFLLYYFSESSGTYTERTAAYILANEAAGATQLPAFLFGNSDFASGFTKLKSQFALSGWSYGDPFVYGKDYPATFFGVISSTVRAKFRSGDLVLQFYIDDTVNYCAFLVVRCTQVAYSTLLDALSSDMFTLNMIRYVMDDTTAVGLAQYSNNVNVFKQSLFGKFDSDFVSPNSFKIPEQQQNGIIDIPLVKGIDKQVALATFQNYDAINVKWSLFVRSVNKLDY
jgi:hypothetical protein